MRIKYSISLCILLVALYACGKKIRPSEVSAYIQDPVNGYLLKVTNADMEAVCIYMPVAALVVNNLRTNQMSRKEYKEAAREFGDNSYFNLKLGYKRPPSDDVKSLVNFELQEYIKLVAGKDTLSANSYHAEPYNGVSPYHNILVGFPVKNAGSRKCRVIITYPDPAFHDITFAYNIHTEIKPFQLKYY